MIFTKLVSVEASSDAVHYKQCSFPACMIMLFYIVVFFSMQFLQACVVLHACLSGQNMMCACAVCCEDCFIFMCCFYMCIIYV